MPNLYVQQRLAGIQTILRGVHESGIPMSASSKGSERAAFVDDFLSKVLPSPYRFGSGDATDQHGNRSGQLDVVVEYPFMPSLPSVGGNPTRLYLAESIAAVIEVKSDLTSQWAEARATGEKVAVLQRQFGATMSLGAAPGSRIPFFVAAYTGQKSADTLRKRLSDSTVDGILVIDPGVFVSTQKCRGITATGEWALWGLIACLHDATSTLKATSTQPIAYALDDAG